MDRERFKVFEKVIDHCYESCPYFGVDGGPSPVMCCDHPQLEKEGLHGYGTCIIKHPICDTGFPEKCPLRRLPESKVESGFLDGMSTPNETNPEHLSTQQPQVESCEWEAKEFDGWSGYSTTCGERVQSILPIEDMRFCPYCSRKLKNDDKD